MMGFHRVRIPIFAAILAFMVQSPAFAALVIKSVSNASNLDKTSSESTPIIYGGVAGPLTNCDDDGTELCNSCEDLTSALMVDGCNTKRIFDGLLMRIEFTIDTLDRGKRGVAYMATSDDEPIEIQDETSGGNGDTMSFRVDWQDICLAIDDASCEAVDAGENLKSFKIGIDVDGDGFEGDSSEYGSVSIKVQRIGDGEGVVDLCDAGTVSGVCDYTIKPGDEKVYIEDPETADGYPQYEGLNFKKLRVFYSKESFADAIPGGSENSKDLKLDIGENDGEIDLPSSNIDGLDNDTFYFFRIGSVDDAQNVGFITSDAAIDEACGDSGLTADDVDDAVDADCRFIAKPAPVFGVLTEDTNCFISTAAFGSSLAPEVKMFRQFRNRILLPTALGRKLTFWYYNYGSKAAKFMQRVPELKPIARALLWPVAGFASLTMKMGAMGATAILMLLVIASVFSVWGLINVLRQPGENESQKIS